MDIHPQPRGRGVRARGTPKEHIAVAPPTRHSRRQHLFTAASIALVLAVAGSALAGPGGPKGDGGGANGGKKQDSTPPAVAFLSPSPGAVISGRVSVSGTASDNV